VPIAAIDQLCSITTARQNAQTLRSLSASLFHYALGGFGVEGTGVAGIAGGGFEPFSTSARLF
jgi:hypothetical protein